MNFDFAQDYVLEDSHALLRPLQLSDVDNLLYFSVNEPDLWRYSLAQGGGISNLKAYIEAAVAGRSAEREYPFIVFDKVKNTWAGSTRFYDMQLAQQTLQLGYTWYGKAHQGTGLNKHCKYLLLQAAFERMNIQRVEFRADAENERSIRAMKSIGCVPEGILRSNGLRPDGSRRDSIVLRILKSEWEGGVKERLQQQL